MLLYRQIFSTLGAGSAYDSYMNVKMDHFVFIFETAIWPLIFDNYSPEKFDNAIMNDCARILSWGGADLRFVHNALYSINVGLEESVHDFDIVKKLKTKALFSLSISDKLRKMARDF